MPPEFACPTVSSAALAALESAAMQLQRISQRLFETGALARRAAAATDWQTPAARAFFAVAERLTADVLALGPVADAVMAEIAFARIRASVENSGACR